MNIEDALVIFNMLKNDDNIQRYLLATPFTKNHLLNFSMTEDYFFKQMYSNPNYEKVDFDLSKIKRNLKNSNKDTIFILGNKGCGKTTFINKIIYEIKKDENIRAIYISAGDPYINNKPGLNNISESLINYLFLKIMNFSKTDCKILSDICNIYNNSHEIFDNTWDTERTLKPLMKCIEKALCNDKETVYDCLVETIRDNLRNLVLEQMFMLIVLLDICEQYNNDHNHIMTAVFLDNLDNLKKINEIDDVISRYYNFEGLISDLIEKINEKNDIECKKYDYTFSFVMRENTKSYITQHNIDTYLIGAGEYDITTLYTKEEIVFKRARLVIDSFRILNENDLWKSKGIDAQDFWNFKTLYIQIINIVLVLQDNYIKKTIFPFYNNDYRVCIRTLIEICNENEKYIEEYIDLVVEENGSKFGGRGIIYKLILNKLKANGDFDKMRLIELKTNRDDKNTSLSRLILTYLNNTTNVECTEVSRKQSLFQILDNLSDVDLYKKRDIVECIWQMYDLIESLEWNHLLTFATSNDVSEEGLKNELNNYYEIKNNTKNKMENIFSTFRITCAGVTYLEHICTHFEFFSTRIFSDTVPPLFSKESLERTEDGKYYFEKIIEEVFHQTSLCCSKLYQSIEAPNGICEKNKDLLYTKKPVKKSDKSIKMYHSERLIYSHIGYLDEYRCYILKKKPQNINLEQFSLYIIDIITHYLDLFVNKNSALSLSNTLTFLKNEKDNALENPLDFNRTIKVKVD